MQRHLHLFHDLAAAGGEVQLEEVQGVIAGRVVGGQRRDLLDAVLGGPVTDDGRRLRQREGGADDVGRALGNDRGARRHHDFRNLGLCRQRCRRECGRRHAEACDEIDLVVDDQFLREALGVVGNRRIILQDDFDLLAGNGVAVLLHIEFDRVVDLLAGRCLATGHRQDQADLDGFLGVSRRERQHAGDGACGQQHVTANRHEHLSP